MPPKRKINLAYIMCRLDIGGAERLVLDLVNNLDREIFNLHVITIKGGGEWQSEFEQTGITLKMFNKKSHLGLKTIYQLAKYLRAQKIDIVHTHLFAGDTWGRLAAILARVPVILTTDHNLNFDEGLFKKITKKALSIFNTKIFAVSLAVKKYLIEKEWLTPDKINILYNGIVTQRFNFQSKYNFNPAALRLVMIGRLEYQKGQDIAIKALSKIIKKYPQTTLTIYGLGSQAVNLKKLIKATGLEKNVFIYPPQKNVQEFINQYDLLLVPSRWEGFGLVILEAQAAGIPVLASATGGITEIIQNGQNGYLFENSNPGSLAEKIFDFIERPGQIEALRQRARNDALKFDIKYTVQNYQKYYLEFYENITGK